MPLREFQCARGHVTERILMGKADKQTKLIPCDCGEQAKRIEISRPSEPKLIGAGFYKPSVTGKES